jgi:predicted aldo/keto reductase-like oxidoreductase
MNTFANLYPLGLGTNRFPIKGADDEDGVENSARLVLRALELGVRYIDAAQSYSRGMACEVLRRVFARTRRPYSVTLKIRNTAGMDFARARRQAEASLAAMGISRAEYFVAWAVMSYDEFSDIMRKGGLYDAAVKLRDEGIIRHICFSTHAPVADIIRIIESGAFEGVTLSYSLLNCAAVKPALDAALEYNLGVAVMNPLGGGVIPQNRDYFSFARNEEEKSTVQAALRFAASHPAVNILLSGISSEDELDENISAFAAANAEHDDARCARVVKSLQKLEHFCTGCDYCSGCPEDIPISAIMQSRNSLLFAPVKAYNRVDAELTRNIQIFRRLAQDFSYMPETAENPCVRCGQCETRCTQGLKIADAVSDTYRRMAETCYSRAARRERLDTLLNAGEYRRVGFYPGAGYTSRVLELYDEFFGGPPFEIVLFDGSPEMWGKESSGFTVRAPSEIGNIHPDAILISNYNYDGEIYEAVKRYEKTGIQVKKLHSGNDVPWVF